MPPCLASMLTFSNVTMAAEAKDMKIGFVNIQAVASSLAANGQHPVCTMEVEFKERMDAIKKLESDIAFQPGKVQA